MTTETYNEVARVEERLWLFRFKNQQQCSKLAHGYCHQTPDDETSVPVAGRGQLCPYPDMLLEDHGYVGCTPFEQLTEPLEPQDLELAGKPEQDADQ